MKLSEAFPSNYLKSDDLQDRDVLVVIASAEIEMLGQERKLVLTFGTKQAAQTILIKLEKHQRNRT